MPTYTLYLNERTQQFKIIQSGVTVTEHYDGFQVAQNDSKEYLTGVAHGLQAYRLSMVAPLQANLCIKSLAQVTQIVEKKD